MSINNDPADKPKWRVFLTSKLAIAFLALVVGYILGREQHKFEIRSNHRNVFADVFGGGPRHQVTAPPVSADARKQAMGRTEAPSAATQHDGYTVDELATAREDEKVGNASIDATETIATIQNYIDAFNKGDAKGMAAMFTVPASILDGMAPHLWTGPTAAQDWYREVLAEGERQHASGYQVTLGEPVHNSITGETAYVVVPASMTFQVQDKVVTQTGAFFTVALRKTAEGWRIAAWAWTKGGH